MNSEVITNLLEEFRALRNEVGELRRAQAPKATEGKDLQVDEDGGEDPNEAEEEEEEETAEWTEVLNKEGTEPSSQQGARLSALLGKPPPLDLLKASEKQVPRYNGLPKTPLPRRNALDQKISTAQRKVEHCMNMLICSLDTGNTKDTHAAGAFARSAFEDLQQIRKELYAGKQKRQLEPRADDTRERLLTREEEEKVAKARSIGRRQQPQQYRNDRSNHYWTKPTPRSDFNKRGKGKGKGGGKGDRKDQP